MISRDIPNGFGTMVPLTNYNQCSRFQGVDRSSRDSSSSFNDLGAKGDFPPSASSYVYAAERERERPQHRPHFKSVRLGSHVLRYVEAARYFVFVFDSTLEDD